MVDLAKPRPIADDDELDAWPDFLKRLAGVIGRDRTLVLAQVCGGLDDLYIPTAEQKVTKHVWLRVLTPEEWTRVVAAFGGERVYLPRGVYVKVRKREILRLAGEGVTHRQIALQTQTTERYVRMVLADLDFGEPADERQGKLFG